MTSGSDDSTEVVDTPSSLESELEERLRGARLVLEAIDLPILLRVTKLVALMARSSNAAARLARDYPAVLVAYLVGEGTYNYKAGAFWPNLNVKRLDHDDLGIGFLSAIRRLGLDTFERLSEEKALRYIAPILAHGGIPQYCLKDFFFGLLVPELQRSGASDAGELLAIWRTRKTAFQGIDLPVRRFLLYGGEAALDLLDRCIELVTETVRTGQVPSYQQVGLPRYIVKEFAKGPVHTARLGQGRSLPSPRIRLDPWDPLGPVMELPSLPHEVGEATWKVSDGQAVRNVTGSATESRTLRLSPSRAWDVELTSNGKLLKNMAFECMEENPTVVFDPRSGQYVRDTQTLLLDQAWILCPADTELTGIALVGTEAAVPIREELPDPVGAWQGFKLAHYDLRGLRAIRAERSGLAAVMLETGARYALLRVRPPGQRPELIGQPADDILTEEGYPVFDRMPRLRIPHVADVPENAWRIQVRADQFEISSTAADLGGLEIDLSALQDVPSSGVFSVTARGPLGSDLRATFALVPGLVVDRPSEILIPGATAGSTEVSVKVGNELSFVEEAGADRQSRTLAVPTGSDEVRCAVQHPHGVSVLRIYVPRLLWAVVRTNEVGAVFGAEPIRLGIEELEDGTATAVVVSTRRADVSVALALENRGERLQTSEWSKTSAGQGRAVFDLAPYRDTVRASAESSLDLMLLVLDRRVPLGHVFAKLVVSSIRSASHEMHGWPVVHLVFNEPRTLRGRLARLWSLDRPWEDPVVTQIPDDTAGEAFIQGEILPGPYRVEIALDDPWSSPRRPKRSTPNTGLIHVGTPAEALERYRQLEGADPFAVLELAVRRGQIVSWLEPEELAKIAPAALVAVLELLDDQEERDTVRPPLSAVSTLLFRNPNAAKSAVAEAFADGIADRDDLLRVCLLELTKITRKHRIPSGDEGMRGLWESCPPLASLADVPRAIAGEAEALSRCDAFLGWQPGASLAIGQAASQALLGSQLEELQQIFGILDLVPRQILGLDAFVAANFEWLLAHKDATAKKEWGGVNGWALRNRHLVLLLPQLGEEIASHLAARARPAGAAEYGDFPQVILACALHVLAATEHSDQAAAALREASAYAARLISRDLCLVAVLNAKRGSDA